MAPGSVDLNQKQAKSSIDQVEIDPFVFDRMARTVSAPSQYLHFSGRHLMGVLECH